MQMINPFHLLLVLVISRLGAASAQAGELKNNINRRNLISILSLWAEVWIKPAVFVLVEKL